MSAPFSATMAPGGGRSCDAFRREPLPFRSDGQMQDSQISVRHCLNFGLQNTQGREIQQVQASEYGSQSAGVQNSAKNCWGVLAVFAGAKSTGRCILC